MSMIFYRGITVRPEDELKTRERILSRGLRVEDSSFWQGGFECVNIQNKIKSLLNKRDLGTEDTRKVISKDSSDESGVSDNFVYSSLCASGCKLGASYYALKHNYNPRMEHICPLLIAFKAPLKDVQIDGRDFLYTAFQMSKTTRKANQLEQLFGPKIHLYFDRAVNTPTENQDRKIALCDLAIQDQEIIRCHKRNKRIISGRFGTTFTSAFLVRSPIPPQRVVSITAPTRNVLNPEIKLGEFLSDNSKLLGTR